MSISIVHLCFFKKPTGLICFSLAFTDQFHYLVEVVGCSLISHGALQAEGDGLWNYGCLAVFWWVESCSCCFRVSVCLLQLVLVWDQGGCLLMVLECGAWDASGGRCWPLLGGSGAWFLVGSILPRGGLHLLGCFGIWCWVVDLCKFAFSYSRCCWFFSFFSLFFLTGAAVGNTLCFSIWIFLFGVYYTEMPAILLAAFQLPFLLSMVCILLLLLL